MNKRIARLGIAEFGLMASMFAWVALLFSPSLKGRDESYVPFLDVLPTSVWISICLAIGIAMLFGIIVDAKKLRGIGILLSCAFWLFMFMLLALGNHYLHAVSYLSCAVTALWLFIRKMKEW